MKVRDQCNGFTLIETMIVVAIIAILAMVAYPSYVDHVRKSRRADAQTALFQIAQREEQFYAQNARYTVDLTDLGYTVDGDNYYVVGDDAYYRAGVLAADAAACPIASCYRLQALPNGDQANDRIEQFVLWSTGRKQKKVEGATSNGWEL